MKKVTIFILVIFLVFSFFTSTTSTICAKEKKKFVNYRVDEYNEISNKDLKESVIRYLESGKRYKGKEKDSPTVKNINSFSLQCKENDVDVVFALSVSILETDGGLNPKSSARLKNLFGIQRRDLKGYREFQNYADSISEFCWNMRNGSNFFQAGKTSLKEIGDVYAPEQKWDIKVSLIMQALYSYLE